MEYIIHKQTTREAEVLFIDPVGGLTYVKTISIADCDTREKLDERINDHLRAFSHRVNVGVITEASLPHSDMPTDIVIDGNLSKESKLALASVIQAKTQQMKDFAEDEAAKLAAANKSTTSITQKIATIDAALQTAISNKRMIEGT